MKSELWDTPDRMPVESVEELSVELRLEKLELITRAQQCLLNKCYTVLRDHQRFFELIVTDEQKDVELVPLSTLN